MGYANDVFVWSQISTSLGEVYSYGSNANVSSTKLSFDFNNRLAGLIGNVLDTADGFMIKKIGFVVAVPT